MQYCLFSTILIWTLSIALAGCASEYTVSLSSELWHAGYKYRIGRKDFDW